ncbi:MAG: TlpA family protein disulfide reductase [Conexibacter sp.]
MALRSLVVLVALAAAGVAGCGSSGGSGGGAFSPNATPPPAPPDVARAAHPTRSEFPAVSGRTLRQLADALDGGGPQVAPATTEYVPGRNRVAFGVIGRDGRLLYGDTAVYVARGEHAKALGPFLAPADSLQVRPAFRSETSAGDADVTGVYHADVELPGAGRWLMLTVTRSGGRLLGGAAAVEVRRSSPVPAVGAPAPRMHTPTLASVGGDVAKIDTRVPPSRLHDVDFFDVVGKRPVALLFATPALCRSRVCGPVADEAVQLQTAYGNRMTFIHNEVYVDNDPSKGLRPQLRAFGLTSEPWLFVIDRRGRIAARLEGAFGIDEFRAAIERGLRGAPAS